MNNGFWNTWQRASCLPDCWCEAPRLNALIVEPANTWTNISYIIAAIFIFRLSYKTKFAQSNSMTKDKRFTYLYAGSLFFLGLGSFFFHASLTFWGQWFDVMGMYLITFYFIAYNFVRSGYFKFSKFSFTYLLSVALAGALIYYIPESRRYLFGLSIGIILVSSLIINHKIKAQINHRVLYSALGVFAFGFLFWNLDKFKVLCDPYALFNGHGVWHFCGGLAAYLLYRYYLTESLAESEFNTQINSA